MMGDRVCLAMLMLYHYGSPIWILLHHLAITKALSERAIHPIYGYTIYPDSLYESLAEWLGQHHGWHKVQRDWIVMCPGVVPSLHAAAMAFSEPGESIIVQPPVYFPFFLCGHKYW